MMTLEEISNNLSRLLQLGVKLYTSNLSEIIQVKKEKPVGRFRNDNRPSGYWIIIKGKIYYDLRELYRRIYVKDINDRFHLLFRDEEDEIKINIDTENLVNSRIHYMETLPLYGSVDLSIYLNTPVLYNDELYIIKDIEEVEYKDTKGYVLIITNNKYSHLLCIDKYGKSIKEPSTLKLMPFTLKFIAIIL